MKEKYVKNIELRTFNEKRQKEENIDDYEIPNYDLSSYFQSFDLKNLSSYKNLDFQDINNSDILFGNNYSKFYMTSNLLKTKNCSRKHPKKLGNLYSYFFINNEPLITIGTNKLFLVIIYQFFLHISYILINISIINKVFPYMKYMLSFFYYSNFLSHMYIFLFNAGIPSPENFSKKHFKIIPKEQQKLYQVCDICNIIVPYEDEIKHCNECNICIKAIDHHCYWVGKCITKNNYIAFHIFTFTILLYYVWYAIIIVVWAILEIAKRRYK